MLTRPHCPPDETPTLLPHLCPHHSLCFHPPPLPSLCSRGALLTCLRHRLPSLHASNTTYDPYACGEISQHASDTAHNPYACVVPSQHASNTTYNLFTCAEPSQHASNTTYDPYACSEPSQHASNTANHPYSCPSQHASDTTYNPYACGEPTANHPYACVSPSQNAVDTANHPYTCVVPSQHASDTAYHPYGCVVPSQHASDTAYHAYTFALNMRLQCLPPSLPSQLLMLTPPAACNPYAPAVPFHLPSSCFCITSIVYGGLLVYTINAIKEICLVAFYAKGPKGKLPPSSQKPNFKSYEKEKTVETCAPTEDAGQDDVIFSGEVEILSKEQFVSNIAQKITRIEKIQNDSKIPDYVRQKIAEAMSLLRMDMNQTEVFFDNNIWNLKLMKESGKPPDNLPKSEHSFFKMVPSLLYPANPVTHSWANVMFESISLVSYNVIAPKPCVALTSNSTDPFVLKRGAVEYLAPA
ncbi:hypothetical protein O181_035578 [Austropuccinia psidii MF-1]|uniref:Uncharacterized protein n=1 Tax=Austropuccinia psidii MF-1 TaxID=1389203 RepID=A0A9Q3H8D8_9BASI|nr:hypothetical protein [Austropuccinia psidii MF-1]